MVPLECHILISMNNAYVGYVCTKHAQAKLHAEVLYNPVAFQ